MGEAAHRKQRQCVEEEEAALANITTSVFLCLLRHGGRTTPAALYLVAYPFDLVTGRPSAAAGHSP